MRHLHRKQRILLLLAAVLLFAFGLTVQAGTGDMSRGVYSYTGIAGWPEAPETSAASVYLIELNSGAVLYEKDSELQSFPASTTKIMTALLTLEHCSLDEQITLSHDAIYDIEEGGHHYDFEEGEVLTVDECLRFLMVESVNEIGYALAEHIGGSLSGFADMMNERAKQLGAVNTHFVNPHGLNDEEHVTTAKDMAMILWGCVQNEQFRYYASLTSVSGIRGRAVRTEEDFPTFTNHHLMLQPESEYYDPDVVCGKTGYTSLAGNTLVTYASRDGMDVVCVLMQGLSDRFQDTRLLLDYAFDNFYVKSTAELAAQGLAAMEEPFTAENGTQDGAAILLPQSYDFAQLTSNLVVGEPDTQNMITGIRTWTLGDQTVCMETVAAQAVPETETPAPTQAPEAASASGKTEEARMIFGWRASDLAILGGLIVLLLALFILLFFLIHRWFADRKTRKRRARYRRERILRDEEEDDEEDWD